MSSVHSDEVHLRANVFPTANSAIQPASAPDARGRFGRFGGRYAPEGLIPALRELESAWREARADPVFLAEYTHLLARWVGRPTALTPLDRFARLLDVPGLRVYAKREDLAHTGAHKITNALGQGLLAVRMGKRRIIAETGAGQHGVATAAVCALLGLECVVYIGAYDMRRQRLNVARMRTLGAQVRVVSTGTGRVKDAVGEAIRDFVASVDASHFLFGSTTGPTPYPEMVRDFQAVIGAETRTALLDREQRLPDLLVACVGGGSNALGLFHPFLGDDAVRMVGVEAAGRGAAPGEHAATLTAGSPGVFQGVYSYLLQDADGNTAPTHSIAAGLDYPGVGPEHSDLRERGRVRYVAVTDDAALRGFHALCRTEGIIPSLECAHAVGWLLTVAPELPPDALVVLALSGRGDKDIPLVNVGERWDPR
jgi:tryptophan synthase beta chain